MAEYYNHQKLQPIKRNTLGDSYNKIFDNFSIGLQATGFPMLILSTGFLISYYLGRTSGITDLEGNLIGGKLGTAMATMGMFCTGSYIVSVSEFGVIIDNAVRTAKVTKI